MAEHDCINDAMVASTRSSWAPGDTVLLTGGVSYIPFSVPSIANGSALTIKMKNQTFTAGTRLTDAQASTLPRIVVNNSNINGPHLEGTGTVVWEGISFISDYSSDPGSRDLCTGGDPNGAPTSIAQLPANLRWQWCLFDGAGLNRQRQGIQFRCNGAAVYDSIFRQIAKTSDEPKALAWAMATGTLDIRDNWFDRCGMTVLAHGSGHTMPSTTMPAQLIFEQNYIYWSTAATPAGAKAHIELKGWFYPRIVGNIIQNYWENAGQNNVLNFSDYSIVDGWRRGRGILVAYNQFLNCHGKILGIQRQNDGLLPNNGGGLRFMHNFGLVGRDPRNGAKATNPLFVLHSQGITIERNTLLADQNVEIYGTIQSEANACRGIRINRNILPTPPPAELLEGVFFTAQGTGHGVVGLDAAAGTGLWQAGNNAIGGDDHKATGGEPATPASNTYLTNNAALASALDATTYEILSSGALAGLTVGADMSRIRAYTGNVVAGTVGPTRLKLDSPYAGFRA